MIGKILKYIRKKNKLTQKQLASNLNIAQTTLSGYETKYSNPTFEVIEKIANRERLEPKYRDHQLLGYKKCYRECHIKPDWLLIYKYYENELVLLIVATGSHSEVF